jgi:hypothetical protein
VLIFLLPALEEDEWSALGPWRKTHWLGGEESFLPLPGIELRFTDRQGHIVAQYRLSYPGFPSAGAYLP